MVNKAHDDVFLQDVTEHKLPALHHHYKDRCWERLSVNVGLVGGVQETYLGQLRTMGWRVYLFCTLLCSAGLSYSHDNIQTEEYKAEYLPYFITTEDSNEKQLVSYS